jgi:tRNA (mo5U34)-methyltransferase
VWRQSGEEVEPRISQRLLTIMEEGQTMSAKIAALGIWFQNFQFGEIWTAPNHPLGDYPRVKWDRFRSAIPDDLYGKSVLEIGCNAGFYAFEMKKRGAGRVVGIDTDQHYLRQAEFVREVLQLEVEFFHLSVYDVGELQEKFDLVLFLGVLYHLRYPLLALDLVRRHSTRDLLVVQSMLRGSPEVENVADDYSFWDTEVFSQPGYPKMHFVEKAYAGDPTNWWIPNRACLEATIRSAGFKILRHPEEEVYVCQIAPREELDDDRSCHLLE